MPEHKKKNFQKKQTLHERNKHQGRYDLEVLVKTHPELAQFIVKNKYGDDSVDFFNPKSVKALNKALLLQHYKVDYWEIPEDYLCPPIPGRADYLHHIADLLAESNSNQIPKGPGITCLDVGVGANCIYPLIGTSEYGWSFIGTDVDPIALENASKIVENNPSLKDKVQCRLQTDQASVFNGVINKDEKIDLVICNPPFHSSLEEAQAGTLRKLSNLKKQKVSKVSLNFGGKGSELWTEGGEKQFIDTMITESATFGKQCGWFSTLVAKQKHLDAIYKALEDIEAQEYKTIVMGQGNKSSRIVAWTFLTYDEEEAWAKERWNND